MEEQDKIFTPGDIEKFVKDHIQSKIDNHELGMVGFDMDNPDNFKGNLKYMKMPCLKGF